MGIIRKTEGIDVAGAYTGSITADTGSIGTAELATDAVTTVKITDDNVTLAKLVDFTGQGYILRGGTSGAPEEHDASTSGQILVGDGSDIASVAVSGDVTLSSAGAVTIASVAVETAMIAANAVTSAKMATVVAQTATVNITNGEALALATPKTLVAAPGATSYVVVDEVTAFNNFGTVAFAFSDAMSIKYTNDSGDSACTDIPEVAFCEAGADAVATTHGIDCIPVANAAVVAVVGTNPTSGDGDFDLEVKYRVVSFTT